MAGSLSKTTQMKALTRLWQDFCTSLMDGGDAQWSHHYAPICQGSTNARAVPTMIKRGPTGGVSHLLDGAKHRIVLKCHIEGLNRQLGDFCAANLGLFLPKE